MDNLKELYEKAIDLNNFFTRNQYIDTSILKEPVTITYAELESRYDESEGKPLTLTEDEILTLSNLINGFNYTVKVNPRTDVLEIYAETIDEVKAHIDYYAEYITCNIKETDLEL